MTTDDTPFCRFTPFIISEDNSKTVSNSVAFTDEIISSLNSVLVDSFENKVSKVDALVKDLSDRLQKDLQSKIYPITLSTQELDNTGKNCLCKALNKIESVVKDMSVKATSVSTDALVLADNETIKPGRVSVFLDHRNKRIVVARQGDDISKVWDLIASNVDSDEVDNIAQSVNLLDEYNRVKKQEKGKYELYDIREEQKKEALAKGEIKEQKIPLGTYITYLNRKDGFWYIAGNKCEIGNVEWRGDPKPRSEAIENLKRQWSYELKKGGPNSPFYGYSAYEYDDNCKRVGELGIKNDVISAEKERIRQETERELAARLKVAQWPNWSDEKICDILSKPLDYKLKDAPTPIGQLFDVRDGDGVDKVNKSIQGFVDDAPLIPDWVAKLLSGIVRAATDVIDSTLTEITKATGCPITSIAPSISAFIVQKFLGKWLGFEIPKLTSLAERNINTQCPEQIPSETDADEMYLANVITDGEWECWVKANNTIPVHRKKLLQARRQRLSTDELIRLWLRDKLSPDELKKRLRELGWTKDSEVEDLKVLAYQNPTASDLIPWMLRDVFDKNIVEAFGLDNEFEAKYTARAKELFKGAGISDEIAYFEWAAHWKMPSNTQLFEMYHRLRGGEEFSGHTRYYDKDGNKLAKPIRLSKDDIKVTEQQIAQAIGVNDFAPFWRDKLLAISRPPLTRVDVRRAFEIDAIGEKDVFESYLDLGYDENNARTLTNFAKRLKEKGNVRKQGKLLPTRIAALYKQSLITRTDAIELLKGNGIAEKDAAETVRQAEIEVKAKRKATCIKAVRKRFMIGDIDEAELRRMLSDIGLEQEQVIEMVKAFKCELQYKTKEITASQLCEWYKAGLMDDDTYKMRLVRIGYTELDADNIIDACEFSTLSGKEKPAKRSAERERRKIKARKVINPEKESGNGEKGKE